MSVLFGLEVNIQKPDSSSLQEPSVNFRFKITDDSGACVIYIEEHNNINMSGTNGQKSFQLGNTLVQSYPNPLITLLTIDQVFSSSGVVYNCEGGGTYTSTSSASRKLILEFDDGSGLQTLPAMAINSVPYAIEAQKVVNNSITTQNILDGTITASDLGSMGAVVGQVMKWNGTFWIPSNDNAGTGLVNSVAGRNGDVILSSGDISGLGTLAGKNLIQLSTDVTGTLPLTNISQSSATTGQVIKWNGSAWVVSDDSSGLSNFSSLTSADITGKLGYTPLANYGSMTSTDVTTALGYTPVNPATAVISVAGRTGAVTLSSADISGISFGTTSGTFAQGNDSRLSDTRTPTDNTVTSAKIVDGTIVSADISAGAITFDKLNQSAATTGQVIKWNGSAWVVSDDSSGLSDFSSLTSADITGKLGYTPLSSYGSMTSNDVTTALAYVPLSPSTSFSGDISGVYSNITVDRIKNVPVALSSLTSGDIIQYNGSAFVNRNIPTCAANQYLTFNGTSYSCVTDVGAGGTVGSLNSLTGALSIVTGSSGTDFNINSASTTITLNLPTASSANRGLLSSADWTVFNSKLSDFATLTSADVTGKLGYTPLANYGSMTSTDVTTALGYTPVNLATAVISVAGHTGAVTLSSSDISGISFGTTSGTFAQGNDSRLSDTRTPTDNTVTSAKIVDGTIQSSDISAGAITFDKLNQSAATTGQVIKWNGSAWVVSDDNSSAGTVTSVTASGPLSSSGGATPNITIAQANGTTSGYLSSTDFSAFAAKLSDFSTLTSADITGKLGYTPLANYSSMVSTDVTNALGYVPANVGSVILASQMPANCSAGQTLTFSSPTGSWVCSNIVLANDSVLSAMISSVDWSKVANRPSTLTGYGITLVSSDVTTALSYVPLSPSTSFSGDISGVYNNITVNRIKNIPVTLSSITSGDIVQYNGSAFVNRNIPTCAANQYLTFNGTNYTCVTDVGASGTVGSINTLTGALNLVTGTSGSNFNIDSTGTTITLNMPTASSANRGLLSSADWTTFNSKLSDFSTLTSADITGKLGYTPLANYGSMTSTDVTTALGYTPVNPATAVISVAGRTGAVTLSSSDISGLGTLAGKNQIQLSTDVTGALPLANIAQSSATTGQVIKWNGSAWVVSDDNSSAGTVTSVTASGPLSSSGGANPNISLARATAAVDGYLSSTDFTTFAAKLSDFSTLTSADITGKLGYTPVNPATAVISVAGRTGAVTLSSSDISGISFGTTSGTFAQGNDSRLSDTRTPTDNTVTSAKIVDGAIQSADISAGAITFDKLNQSAATTGQVIKWNGSAWVASADSSSGGTVTSVTASGPLSSSGGTAPNITIARSTAAVDGYLASADFSTFAAKLSDFSSLTSADVTGKLGYIPLRDLASMTSTDVSTALGYVPANVNQATQWINSGSDIYFNTGNIGVGTVAPGAGTKLKVQGQIVAEEQTISSGNIDFSAGNVVTTTFDCSTSLSFSNLRRGGNYVIVVTDVGTSQCNFSVTTTGDDAATVSYRYAPVNTLRTASSHTVYNLTRVGNVIYVSWVSGF